MIIAIWGLVILGTLLWVVYSSFASYIKVESALKRIKALEAQIQARRPAPEPAPAAAPEPVPIPIKPKPKPAPKLEAAKPVRVEPVPVTPPVDWESFTGANIFSWIGGFALFLGAAFFVKYSIDHDLITPMARVTIGYLAGIAAMAAGTRIRGRRYRLTAHTLTAAGAAILYADTFAAHAFYGFLAMPAAFGVMVLVSIAAFLAADEMDSKWVAVLGLAGSFLTPPLLSTGADHPLGLFGYVALLDCALIMLALRKGWGFLAGLAAFGTLATQFGWVVSHFAVEKVWTSAAIFTAFPLLFTSAWLKAHADGDRDPNFRQSAALVPIAGMLFGLYLLSYAELAASPVAALGLLFALDAVLAALAVKDDAFRPWQLAAGALALIAMTGWMSVRMTPDNLYTGLFFTVIFAGLHAAVPVALQAVRPSAKPYMLGNLYPLLMLVPVMVPVLNDATHSWAVWLAVFMIDAAAAAAALAAGAALPIALALAGTTAIGLVRLGNLPDAHGLPGLVAVMTLFAAVFYALGLFLKRRSGGERTPAPDWAPPGWDRSVELPALAALAPFAILVEAGRAAHAANPAPFFGAGLILTLMVLALVKLYKADGAAPMALLGVFLMELAWHARHFGDAPYTAALPWYCLFLGVFLLYPFVFETEARPLPWITAALAGPAQFFLLHAAWKKFYGTDFIGALPAGLAAVYLTGLYELSGQSTAEDPDHRTRLAWFGGTALLFITLVFPLQFDKEWITLGWALEGAALVWLYRRVPHEGLKTCAAALLAIAFARLALNPAVFSYHERSATPIVNWFLYTYGTAIAAMFAAAELWSPREGKIFGVPAASSLRTGGTILAFLLLNIEIADYYSTGQFLALRFSGSLGQDMTTTLAWGLFAVALLAAGLLTASRGARLGAVGLLVLTSSKLFLHDIWDLGQLYRVASLVGFAAILIFVSTVYQRMETSHAS